MVLVTGATGLVGSHLIYKLLSEGEQVRGMKRPQSDTEKTRYILGFYGKEAEKLFDKIEWVEADLLDYDALADAMDDVEVVYHTGALVSFNPKLSDRILETNEQGTANLVNAALEKKIRKFCFVSSIASLGNSKNGELIDEFSYWQGGKGHSVYSLSKFKAEMEVWRATKEGLNAVIVNPSVIIGAGDWKSGSPRTIRTINKGLPFYTTGGTGFVDVRDVVKAMYQLVKSDVINERFVINGANLTYQEFFNHIADALKVRRPRFKANKLLVNMGWRFELGRHWIMGSEPVITKESARTSLKITRYSGDKITKEVDFTYTPFEDTIKDVVAYYQNR